VLLKANPGDVVGAHGQPKRLLQRCMRHRLRTPTQSMNQKCEYSARIVAGRWKAAVLDQLLQGTKRFSELKRGISGSHKERSPSNSATCRARESLNVRCTRDSPPRVVYAGTPSGRSLRPLLQAMCHWVGCHGKSRQVVLIFPNLYAIQD
jgi:DNA-binding HxlR family transcriptional regulator